LPQLPRWWGRRSVVQLPHPADGDRTDTGRGTSRVRGRLPSPARSLRCLPAARPRPSTAPRSRAVMVHGIGRPIYRQRAGESAWSVGLLRRLAAGCSVGFAGSQPRGRTPRRGVPRRLSGRRGTTTRRAARSALLPHPASTAPAAARPIIDGQAPGSGECDRWATSVGSVGDYGTHPGVSRLGPPPAGRGAP
jgi:hypothetical protein